MQIIIKSKLTLFLLSLIFMTSSIFAQNYNAPEVKTTQKKLKKVTSNLEVNKNLEFIISINDKKDAFNSLKTASKYYTDYFDVKLEENYKNNTNEILLNIIFKSNQKEAFYSAQRLIQGNGFLRLKVGKEEFETENFFIENILPLGY